MPQDTAPNRIVLIEHGEERADNRVHVHLAAKGYVLDVRRPYRGDPLPAPGDDIAGAVVFGGLYNAFDTALHPFLRQEYAFIDRVLAADVPLLGICLGAQMIALSHGARVGPPETGVHEFGYYEVTPTPAGADILPHPLHLAQSHWHGFDLPGEATLLASSGLFPHQAFRIGAGVFGLQFHAEVTPAGFRAWQERSAARYGLPGVQSRSEQDRLMAQHDAAQAAWFEGFLSTLFARPCQATDAAHPPLTL